MSPSLMVDGGGAGGGDSSIDTIKKLYCLHIIQIMFSNLYMKASNTAEFCDLEINSV
jgi:hypothetical protein